MNEFETQVIRSLQFLVSMQKPKSERYQDEQAEIMSKNYLLFNPIKQPSIAERTHDALSKTSEVEA